MATVEQQIMQAYNEGKAARFAPDGQALAEFTAYFVNNYPGPDTIISKPEWHAPKIFAAAKRALLSAAPIVLRNDGSQPEDMFCIACDGYGSSSDGSRDCVRCGGTGEKLAPAAEAEPVAAELQFLKRDLEQFIARLGPNVAAPMTAGDALSIVNRCADAAPQQPAPAVGADSQDAERLNFLDGNLKWKMGWRVGTAPVGNVSIQSVGNSNVSIRAAIDAAIALQAGEQS